MGLWTPSRVPEPEVMDDSVEAEAYASAAAEDYLARIDATFIEHALRLGVEGGKALDIGTGPGQIPIALARRLPRLEVMGIDRSRAMLEKAGRAAREAGLVGRVRFQEGDGSRLEFPDASFDLVMCNSVLHHLERPVAVLDEIARVLSPEGALLVRDLRRPGRIAMGLHLRWFGRYYSGRMRELYEASVRAAYTRAELEDLLGRSRLKEARTFAFGLTHIGIERPRPGARPAGESRPPEVREASRGST